MDAPLPDDSPPPPDRQGGATTRALELVLALACLAIAGAAFWLAFGVLREPTTVEEPRATKLAVAYIAGFVGGVAALLAVRLRCR